MGLGSCGDAEPHAKSSTNCGNLFADAAVAHHCQRFSGEFLHGVGHDAESLCLFPRTLPDSGIILCHAAVVVEDQGKGVLCHGIGGIACYIADCHAVCFCGGNVNVVVAGGTFAHIPQLRTAVEQFRRNGRFVAENAVGIAHTFRQLFRCGEVVDLHFAKL